MRSIGHGLRPILIACIVAAGAPDALAQGSTGEWDCQATVQPVLQGATAHVITNSSYQPRRFFADNSYSVHLRATELAAPYTLGLDLLRHPQTLETVDLSMSYSGDLQGANLASEVVGRSAVSLHVKVPQFRRNGTAISQVEVSIRGTAASFVFAYPEVNGLPASTLSIYRGSPPRGAANVATTPEQFDAIADLFHANSPLTIEYRDVAQHALIATVIVPAAGPSQQARISLAARAFSQASERLRTRQCSPFIPDLHH